jgi:negative regulator of flagellin synthesis FlgM
MITKINDSTAQMIQQYQKSEPVRSEGDKPAGGGTAITTEKVELSTKAQEYQRIRQILDQVPDVREEKVQELKTRIESGNYQIDAGKLATKMLGESLIDTIA